MNDINFIKGQGGLESPIPGQDHICGIIFYTPEYPSGFDAANKIRQIVDIIDAENKGILPVESEETKASGGNFLITQDGSEGDQLDLTVDGIVIGSTVFSVFSSPTITAAALRVSVNEGSSGYTAAGTGANVLLTPPDGLGDTINGGLHLNYSRGSGAHVTVTQFSGGISSKHFKVIHYHLNEFFNRYKLENKTPELHVMIAPEPVAAYDFAEITALQNFTDGNLRNIGIYAPALDFEETQCTAIQAILATLEAAHKPVSVIFAPNFSTVTDFTLLPNLHNLLAPKVSVLFGQDGNNTGADLYNEKGYTISNLGIVMAVATIKQVHLNIGYVEKFNMAYNVEHDVPALANGVLAKNAESFLDGIHTKGYVFMRKHIGQAGTYMNDSHTCVALTSDYAYLERNQTMDKAIRNTRTRLLPKLNGPLFIDPVSGKLDPATISELETLAGKSLEDMQRDGELSGGKVVIDPAQNVLLTSKLKYKIQIVPVGVNRQMEIEIGFTLKLV